LFQLCKNSKLIEKTIIIIVNGFSAQIITIGLPNYQENPFL